MTIIESPATTELSAVWVELTEECQLGCGHCYAGSGPGKGHGTMTADDWERTITEASACGASYVCIIGGEPSIHPDLPRVVEHALALEMGVEVYTNLVSVRSGLWTIYEQPGVSLATSWYTDDRDQHKAITLRDTFRQTLANIEEAVHLEIPLRVGMVDGILPGQRTAEGESLLREKGVANIGTDRLRDFGRGTKADVSQACGSCGQGKAAILPDGSVTPCPLTRWMTAGNVHESPLGETLGRVRELASTIPATRNACDPDDCRPDVYCEPLRGSEACQPFGDPR